MSSVPKRKGLLAVIAIFLIAIVVGVCLYSVKNFFPGRESRHTTPSQVTARIVEDMQYKDIAEIQRDQLIKHYNIPDDLVEDFSIYMSKSADQSFEIACFKLKETDGYEELEKVIAQHVDVKAQGFKELSPAEYDKIQSYQVVRKRKFVLMLISDDAQAIIKDFFSIV